MPVLKPEALAVNRVDAIKAFHKKVGVPKAELDLSGGIDSAVMACLLKMALGPENVILVHSRFSTNGEQTARAVALAEALEIPLVNGDFSRVFGQVMSILLDGMQEAGLDMAAVSERCKADPTIEGSIRSCLRAPIGRAANRLFGGGIRHGTGNECEDRWLRFYQKGGDGEVDTNPLAMLSKTEVYQLAFVLGELFGGRVQPILKATIDATPSPDLWDVGDGHSDEAELKAWLGVPFTYGRIDSDTGAVTSIGTIERVSRFLELPYRKGIIGDTRIEPYLFGDYKEPDWVHLERRAVSCGLFQGVPEAEALLHAARRAERETRHKANPNIPTLGTREALVDGGILTIT